MRRYLWIITFLIFAPFARADSFAGQYTATSGFITTVTFGGPFMFAGNNFTLTGVMELVGPCPTFYAYGQSIQGCDDGQATPTFILVGGGTFVLKGVGQRSIFINEGEFFFSQAPLPPLDPTTQQTVTLMEPASFSGGFFSCLDVPEPCQPSQEASFSLGLNGEFIATLTSDPLAGGYFVTSEVYTSPEPGTSVLLLAGVGLFGLVMRKRIAQGLQQAT
jgi:hypothetical protein